MVLATRLDKFMNHISNNVRPRANAKASHIVNYGLGAKPPLRWSEMLNRMMSRRWMRRRYWITRAALPLPYARTCDVASKSRDRERQSANAIRLA